MENCKRYNIIRQTGSGGMATVFLAEDMVLNRRVALKRVHPHLIADRRTLRRFDNEIRAASSLAHENIVSVFDCGHDGTTPFLVMEYVEGETLDEIVTRCGALPNLVLLHIATQVLAGLAEAHRLGIVHRDVKPANIMIDAGGTAKLMDFGIAHIVNSESVTVTGTFLGSPAYISPEQAEGEELTAKTDIFSFGSVCYECATGKPPFPGDNPHAIIRAICSTPSLPVCRMNTDVLFFVSEFINRCQNKDGSYRPDAVRAREDIDDFCRELRIPLKKQQIVRFLERPQHCREHDHQNITNALHDAVAEAQARGKRATAIQHLNQLKAFHALTRKERRLLARLKRRTRWIKRIGIAGPVVLVMLLGFAVFLPMYRNSSHKHGVAPPVFKDRDDSVTAIVGKDSAFIKRAADEHGLSAGRSVDQGQHSDENGNSFTPSNDVEMQSDSNTSPRVSPPVQSPTGTRTEGQSGFLVVRSNPPWATIRIDDIEVGQTPRRKPILLRPGRHVLALEKKRFLPFHDTLTVRAGDTVHRVIRLEKREELRDSLAAPAEQVIPQ